MNVILISVSFMGHLLNAAGKKQVGKDGVRVSLQDQCQLVYTSQPVPGWAVGTLAPSFPVSASLSPGQYRDLYACSPSAGSPGSVSLGFHLGSW